MKKLYFDIETGPLSEEHLKPLLADVEAPANLRDPVKIAAAIEERKAKILEDAALHATRGEILAVAWAWDHDTPQVATGSEVDIIRQLMSQLSQVICDGHYAYGWNIHGFDLPYLCKRAAIHGAPLYNTLTTVWHGRHYWMDCFIDAMQVWCVGSDRAGNGLDDVARAMGLPAKPAKGKDFHKLLKSDPDKAVAYAKHDVTVLREIVWRMGV